MPVTTTGPPLVSTTAPAKDTGLYQPFYSKDSGAWGYNSIRTTLPPHYKKYTRAMKSHPNAVNTGTEQLPYLYSEIDHTFVSYDDTLSIQKKAAFAREQQLGGIMNWHAGVDFYGKNKSGELLSAAVEGWKGGDTGPQPPISLTYLGIGFGDNPCNLLDVIKYNSTKERNLTHVNLAFFALDKEYNVVLPKPPPLMVRSGGTSSGGSGIRESGEYDLSKDKLLIAPGTKMKLQALVCYLKKECGLTVLASLGGWNITNSTDYGPNFQNASATESSRAQCARACAKFVTTYGLDGLDVDWEYPGRNPQYSMCGTGEDCHACSLNEMNGPMCVGACHANQFACVGGTTDCTGLNKEYMARPASSPEPELLGPDEKGNATDYKQLMEAIKGQLRPTGGLLTATMDAATWALHWYGWVLKDLVTADNNSTFDYVGIMSYDYTGNWQSAPITGWNANLYVDEALCGEGSPAWDGMSTSSSGSGLGCPQLLWNSLQGNPAYGAAWGGANTHEYLSVSNVVTELFIQGMNLPKKRLILGLPFYGRYFNLKPPSNYTLSTTAKGNKMYLPFKPSGPCPPPIPCATLAHRYGTKSPSGSCYSKWGGWALAWAPTKATCDSIKTTTTWCGNT